jgi:Tfp pilus assembly protein PilW
MTKRMSVQAELDVLRHISRTLLDRIEQYGRDDDDVTSILRVMARTINQTGTTPCSLPRYLAGTPTRWTWRSETSSEARISGPPAK